MNQPERTPNADYGEELGRTIGKLAALLAAPHFPGGDRASLKRWAPGAPPPLSFYRLWLRHLGAELPAECQTPAWMAVAWGLSYMGAGAHVPQRGLGRALAEGQFYEARLERLLAAPAGLRLDLFNSAVRFLAAKGEGFDWTDGAAFLLTTDPEKRERMNRRIAADFYRHLSQGKE
jgi:CRISPR system Cascade subunit CasB